MSNYNFNNVNKNSNNGYYNNNEYGDNEEHGDGFNNGNLKYDLNNNNDNDNDEIHPSKIPRYEDIEDRIHNAEKILESINAELKNKGLKEISKMNDVLKEVQLMKENIRQKSIQDKKSIEFNTREIAMNSLLMVNNEKIKVKYIDYNNTTNITYLIPN